MKAPLQNQARRQDRAGKMEIADLESNVTAVAYRCGMQTHDFTIAWDGGSFEPSCDEHELVIIRKDGNQATVRIDRDALVRRDTWMYFRDLETALTQQNRRKSLR